MPATGSSCAILALNPSSSHRLRSPIACKVRNAVTHMRPPISSQPDIRHCSTCCASINLDRASLSGRELRVVPSPVELLNARLSVCVCPIRVRGPLGSKLTDHDHDISAREKHPCRYLPGPFRPPAAQRRRNLLHGLA